MLPASLQNRRGEQARMQVKVQTGERNLMLPGSSGKEKNSGKKASPRVKGTMVDRDTLRMEVLSTGLYRKKNMQWVRGQQAVTIKEGTAKKS